MLLQCSLPPTYTDIIMNSEICFINCNIMMKEGSVDILTSSGPVLTYCGKGHYLSFLGHSQLLLLLNQLVPLPAFRHPERFQVYCIDII